MSLDSITGFFSFVLLNFESNPEVLGRMTESWMFFGNIFTFVGIFYANCVKDSLESSFLSSISLIK